MTPAFTCRFNNLSRLGTRTSFSHFNLPARKKIFPHIDNNIFKSALPIMGYRLCKTNAGHVRSRAVQRGVIRSEVGYRSLVTSLCPPFCPKRGSVADRTVRHHPTPKMRNFRKRFRRVPERSSRPDRRGTELRFGPPFGTSPRRDPTFRDGGDTVRGHVTERGLAVNVRARVGQRASNYCQLRAALLGKSRRGMSA